MLGCNVRSREDCAEFYAQHVRSKLTEPRDGIIERVPKCTEREGQGTVYVRWDSLTSAPNTDDRHWCSWEHTSLLDFYSEGERG